MIEICTLGGYSEVGKNCTAIRVDDEVVILDMGVQLDKYIKFSEDQEDVSLLSPRTLMQAGAIPNVNKIKEWQKDVIAIVPSHAHLDHIGAIPFLADRFDAEIVCTPYTKALIKAIARDNNFKIANDIISINPNGKYRLSENIVLEFVNVTHSTAQCAIVVLHTVYGKVVYTNDFKFDLTPTLGKKTNMKRLEELGEEGVACLIMDALYARADTKTPSEAVAKELLREVMLGTESEDKAIIVTTFSSQLARLKSIIEFGKQLNRKVVFLGRSLSRYVRAGESVGIIDFSSKVKLIRYRDRMKKMLRKIQKNKGKYVIVCTGHQGEPKAVLSKIVDKVLPFKLVKDDLLIFSCKTIPAPVNIKNRSRLEGKLKKRGVRIFKDVHVSGHGSREDHRDLINALRPKHIIPSHGPKEFVKPTVELVKEMDVKSKVHLMEDGKRLRI